MLLAQTDRSRSPFTMPLAVLIIFGGCATIQGQETPQQAYVWAMYEQGCTRIHDVRMDQVYPDGRYRFRGRVEWNNQFIACMKEQFAKTPYSQWVSQRAASLPTITTAPPSTATPSSSSRTTNTQQPPPDDGEGLVLKGESIPLDTKDAKYQDYFNKVSAKIKRNWIYPREAGDRGIEGELLIEFGIAKSGDLQFILLRRTSGVQKLDEYAMRAIQLAIPFPPVPDDLATETLPISARFRYKIVGANPAQ